MTRYSLTVFRSAGFPTCHIADVSSRQICRNCLRHGKSQTLRRSHTPRVENPRYGRLDNLRYGDGIALSRVHLDGFGFHLASTYRSSFAAADTLWRAQVLRFDVR